MTSNGHFTTQMKFFAVLLATAVFLFYSAQAQFIGGPVTIVSTFSELSKITVTDPDPIVSVQVTLLGLSHGRSGDLHLVLTHTTTNNINVDVDLFSRPGVTGQNQFGAVSTTSGNYGFADSANNTFSAAAVAAGSGMVPNGIYHPCATDLNGNYPLTYFSNYVGAAAGTWTLNVSDGGPGIDGSLDGWELDIVTIPRLSIYSVDANTAVVAWRWPSTGFILQSNSDLGTTNWTTVTNAVNLVNGTNQVTISPLITSQFFRMAYQ